MESAVMATPMELQNHGQTSLTPGTLESLPGQDNPNLQGDESANGQQLAPADGGPAAWRLLIAAFVFEALLWGFPISYGVFQNHYSQLPEFADNPYIPVVGTVTSGIVYLGGSLMTPLIKRYPKQHLNMIYVGWPICILSLVAGSFATTLAGLIITQEILYGTGFLILYYPIISMVNEWWVVRRGFAFGIISSATGVSGVVMPFILQAMLQKYGYMVTLRAVAVALTILTGPITLLFKGRLPPSEQSAMAKTDWFFTRRPLFYVYCVSNLLQGMAYFLPALYLPSYAASIGLSPAEGALLLALMCVAQVLGQFTFGYLSDDRLPLNILAMLSTLVSAVASLALWGTSRSLAPLIIFSLLYGFFGAGFVAMRARMGTAVSSEPTAALSLFSILCFGQGVGNVLAGPISAELLSQVTNVTEYGLVKYKAIVIFTGMCMLFSAISLGMWSIMPRRIRSL